MPAPFIEHLLHNPSCQDGNEQGKRAPASSSLCFSARIHRIKSISEIIPSSGEGVKKIKLRDTVTFGEGLWAIGMAQKRQQVKSTRTISQVGSHRLGGVGRIEGSR